MMVEAQNVTKSYRSQERHVQVLQDASFALGAGERIALIGRSGTGKTTLLNLIGGLDQPDSGQVVVNGKHLERLGDGELSRFRNETVGFIFQTYFLRPQLTALQSVIVPLLFDKVKLRDAMARGREVLEEVGLGPLASAPIKRLSGGQRQRVAIARAIVNRPRLLLADEPTGNLDSRTGHEILTLLFDYNQKNNTTVVLVTHDKLVEEFDLRRLTIENGKVVPYEGPI